MAVCSWRQSWLVMHSHCGFNNENTRQSVRTINAAAACCHFVLGPEVRLLQQGVHSSASQSQQQLACVWILRLTTWLQNSVLAASCHHRVVRISHRWDAHFSIVVDSNQLCFVAQGKTLKSYKPWCLDMMTNSF